MRCEPGWRDIPVIVITAKDLDHEELARLNGRAEREFQKGGYDRAELIGVVERAVARCVTEARAPQVPQGEYMWSGASHPVG